jgi:hypothetical protein
MYNPIGCIILQRVIFLLSHSEFLVLTYNIPIMTTSEENIPEGTWVFGMNSTGNLSILISTITTEIILMNSQNALTK